MSDQWGATPLDFEYFDLKQKILEAGKTNRIEGARQGEYQWVKLCLETAAEALRETHTLRPEMANYISDVLNKVAEGNDVNKGFGIFKRKPGEREKRQGIAMVRANKVERLREVKGFTLSAAVSVVAAKENASEDTIKLAWKSHHKEIKRIMKLEKEIFGKVMLI